MVRLPRSSVPFCSLSPVPFPQKVLEYTQGGDGARLLLWVHHDDAVRD
jgi:hypothetical protein